MNDNAGREIVFWFGLASLLLVTTASVLTAWTVVPALFPRWHSSVVVSGSMQPRIHTGDVVVWRRTHGTRASVGTVIVFHADDGGRTMHRVVGFDHDGNMIVRGDANAQADSSHVRPTQVEGLGRMLIPNVGQPLVWWRAGDRGRVAVFAVVMLAALMGCRFAFRPEFDPWLGDRRPASLPAHQPLWLHDGIPADAANGLTLLSDDLRSTLLGVAGET